MREALGAWRVLGMRRHQPPTKVQPVLDNNGDVRSDRLTEGGRPGARRFDRAPHSLGRHRHLEMSHSECRERIDDRIDHRR